MRLDKEIFEEYDRGGGCVWGMVAISVIALAAIVLATIALI